MQVFKEDLRHQEKHHRFYQARIGSGIPAPRYSLSDIRGASDVKLISKVQVQVQVDHPFPIVTQELFACLFYLIEHSRQIRLHCVRETGECIQESGLYAVQLSGLLIPR